MDGSNMAAKKRHDHGVVVDEDRLEAALQADILEKVGQHPDIRIWRVNVGMAYGYGTINRLVSMLQGGAIPKAVEISKRMRPVKYGVKGQSDIQGFCTYETKSGKAFSRFLAIECKIHPRKATEPQRAWGDMVEQRGGIWILAYSLNDVWERLRREGFDYE